MRKQGPLRYNWKVSSYNSPTDRKDAGRRLQTQLALETDHQSRQWRQCPSWIFDASQQNGYAGLISFAASRSFCHVFQFLQIKSLGSQWFVLKQTKSYWVWSIHELSTVCCLKLWREVEYCWFYLVVLLLSSQMSDFLCRTQGNLKLIFIYQEVHCCRFLFHKHDNHNRWFVFCSIIWICTWMGWQLWILRKEVISIWQSISRKCARILYKSWSFTDDLSWGF